MYIFCLTQPSPPKETFGQGKGLKKLSNIKVLSFGEDYSQSNCFNRALMKASPFR